MHLPVLDPYAILKQQTRARVYITLSDQYHTAKLTTPHEPI